jgi:hypothetical protein
MLEFKVPHCHQIGASRHRSAYYPATSTNSGERRGVPLAKRLNERGGMARRHFAEQQPEGRKTGLI